MGIISNQLLSVSVAAAILFALSPLDGDLTLASQTSAIVRIAKESGDADLAHSLLKWPTVESCIDLSSNLTLEPQWQKFREKSDLWVCFFRIIEELQSEDKIRTWLAQFDIKLVESSYSRLGPDGRTLGFVCSKVNRKCKIKWNTVEATIPYAITPYAFGFIAYYNGEILDDFNVTVERE
ncbi:hypothetical protein PMI09_00378 [Rhizobium sp. CF122]|uniref:hypothetical protein n=1 Tax=Rhizobium sp. CF122 TaxID=1144312 RepID=UPI0002715BBA|nr:hypothetical protein [Rhizobium sp. CF122]EJL58667.1 hypothetical protein PMI09_00378 [Rhizobium sp. CF122]